MVDSRKFVFVNDSLKTVWAYQQAEKEEVELSEESVIECRDGSLERTINNIILRKVGRDDTLIVGTVLDLADGGDDGDDWDAVLDELEDTLRDFAEQGITISSYKEGMHSAKGFMDMVRFARGLLFRYVTEE